ncbi:radical SAM protein [Nonomuraea ceibae]|uniref:radical SAM protein n=1 Tax=Nonomuraea ceibae TaxID=1935170 RepID=UPI001C5F67DA|nr:radical SAM protein [Nonomuraea ceibae]
MSRLDLVAKLSQDTVWPYAKKVAAGERLTAPLVVDLDPTTFCDLACPECISGTLLNKGRFTKERLAALARELCTAGVKAVVLIGGGEPLAHPGTRDVIKILGTSGLHIGVVTNGTMIDRHLDVIAEYVTWLRVSVDAATPETFGQVRPDRKGRSVFDKVIANMRALAQTKKGALGYSFLLVTRMDDEGKVIYSNHHEVLAAARLAKDIGCDYFELKTLFDEQHFVVQLPDALLRSVRAQIEQARDLRDDSFDLEISSTFASAEDRRPAHQGKAYHTCSVAQLRTLVTPNGVYICSYHRGNDKARLGDAVDEDFSALWEKADLSIIDPSRDCRFHCARNDINLAIAGMAAVPENPHPREEFDRFL